MLLLKELSPGREKGTISSLAKRSGPARPPLGRNFQDTHYPVIGKTGTRHGFYPLLPERLKKEISSPASPITSKKTSWDPADILPPWPD